MQVYLSADIEGTCGIADWSETERSAPQDYRPFQKQMTREVRAACQGALAAGAEGILLKDAHDSARNLELAQLPPQTRILRGWTGDPLSMMAGLDGGDFGAVLFTGYQDVYKRQPVDGDLQKPGPLMLGALQGGGLFQQPQEGVLDGIPGLLRIP